MRISILIISLALCGCTITSYRDGTHSFTRVALGANTQAQTLTVFIKPDGTKVLTLGGYVQEQDKAFGAAAEGATKAIIEAIKPLP